MRLDFSDAHVLVVGDVMLDRWYAGHVRRVSPEAPVPVVTVDDEHESLGGAANVAANVVGLGARCSLAGVAGTDMGRERLQALLEAQGIEGALVEAIRPTTTKTRVLGDRQQVVRLDVEDGGFIDPPTEDTLLHAIAPMLPRVDAVILSDYGKGVCTRGVCARVIEWAVSRRCPVLVDPKTTDWTRYTGATLVTPNFREFRDVVGRTVDDDDAAIEACTAEVLDRFGVGGLLVTRSARGMTLAEGGRHHHIRARALEVFDVTGAGDTVIATLGTSLALGMPPLEAASMANRAAGVVVGRAGSVPVTRAALEEVAHGEGLEANVLPLEPLLERVEHERGRGRRIVFTNGCFDVLHRGHLTYLRAARELGDVLVVGLNSDASVTRLKGSDRPINPEADRAVMLGALGFVDYVTVFGEDTPAALLARLRPDVLVKGADYRVEEVAGREHAGEVVLIDVVEGYSSTAAIERLRWAGARGETPPGETPPGETPEGGAPEGEAPEGEP